MEIQHIFLDEPKSSKWNIALSPTKHHIFLLVIRGSVTYFIENQAISLQAGDALFIPPGTWRSAETDPTTFHMMYSIHFNDSTVDNERLFDIKKNGVIKPLRYDYLKQRLSVLYECWIGKLPYYTTICQGILLEVLGIIKRELHHSYASSPIKRNQVHRIQKHIVQHFREPIRLDDLSKLVDRTPNYISNMFKEVTGYTPVEYMHQIRISTANEMLHNTNMTIGEISDYLGYCDQTYFNFMYKKVVGQPPSHTLKTSKL